MPESCPLWIVVAVLIQRAGLPQADINNIQCHCFHPTFVSLFYSVHMFLEENRKSISLEQNSILKV
jgi:hypothetical protein